MDSHGLSVKQSFELMKFDVIITHSAANSARFPAEAERFRISRIREPGVI
jgi:hypothetical protein